MWNAVRVLSTHLARLLSRFSGSAVFEQKIAPYLLKWAKEALLAAEKKIPNFWEKFAKAAGESGADVGLAKDLVKSQGVTLFAQSVDKISFTKKLVALFTTVFTAVEIGDLLTWAYNELISFIESVWVEHISNGSTDPDFPSQEETAKDMKSLMDWVARYKVTNPLPAPAMSQAPRITSVDADGNGQLTALELGDLRAEEIELASYLGCSPKAAHRFVELLRSYEANFSMHKQFAAIRG